MRILCEKGYIVEKPNKRKTGEIWMQKQNGLKVNSLIALKNKIVCNVINE